MVDDSIDQPDLPTVLFDGDCGFCKKWIARWEEFVGDTVEFREFQTALDDFPYLDPVELEQAMHFVDSDGEIYRGAHAVLRTLSYSGYRRHAWLLALYEHVEAFALICDAVYRFIADHRVLAAKTTRWLWGDPRPQGFGNARWLFFRLLAVASLSAFVSIWVQIHGLVGSEGILPAADFLEAARANVAGGEGGFELIRRVPTLFWLSSSDAALTAVCAAGTLLSGLLLFNVFPRLVLPLIWVLYLSICWVGQVFLGYQWDALLLETLFFSFWLAPRGLWPTPRRSGRVPRPARWLMWFLLFKLMFLSGVVKLLSEDPTWANFTALEYHYWTQPLPTWTAYYVDSLPDVFHGISTASMFGIELFVPFLIFAPRRIRHLSAILLLFLQVVIAATGNYGFFNVLSIALCVLLFDDRAIRFLTPSGLRRFWSDGPDLRRAHLVRWKFVLGAIVFTALFALSFQQLERRITGEPAEGFTADVASWVRPLRSINAYGLFAVMTTQRREITVQGSNNGQDWKTYRFVYKPGAVDERPKFAPLHMPRLDWQMWFAALGRCGTNRWFHAFVLALLEGRKPVEKLLADVPFEEPPRMIRTPTFHYRFGQATWWEREPLGRYCPTVGAVDGRLRRVNH